MSHTLTLSGVAYDAALSHVEPRTVRKVGYGRQVVLEAPDGATKEAWIDLLAEAACEYADLDKWAVVSAIYDALDRDGGER